LNGFKKNATLFWNQTKWNLFKFDDDDCNEIFSILNTDLDQLTNSITYKCLENKMYHA